MLNHTIATVVLAAEANPTDFSYPQFFMALVVFGIAFGVLAVVVWPKILGALEARDQRILSDIEQAEKARGQAESALKEYEKALADARGEAARIIEEAKRTQQQVVAELGAKAEAERNDLRDAAIRDIEQAKRAAVSEVYAEIVGVSTGIASKILGREINAEDQRGLVEESLGQLQAVRT